MQSSSKPKFASWLIEQVGSGQYRGLHYVDHNRFRIPWKHNSKKDCNDDDSKIFKAWAEASGKIHKFPNDKARWKLNFRNALPPHIKMVEDNSKTADPHKIYEVTNVENNHEQMMTQEDYDMEQDVFNTSQDIIPRGNELDLSSHFMAMDLVKLAEEQCLIQEELIPSVPVGYPVAPENCLQQSIPAPVHGFPHQPPIDDLEITIHYRKREMLKRTLNVSRLQLHYLNEDAALDALPLCFPSTESLLDHKQTKLTNTILESIQRGLLLEVRDSGIYALRQDRCRVFATTSLPSGAHREPSKLPQNIYVELLNFAEYANELRAFKENKGGSPHYTIHMCFGEKIPDENPLEKKLIVVTVVPLICRHFHEMAQKEGASSLNGSNISLQISHNSLFDLIDSAFNLPTADDL